MLCRNLLRLESSNLSPKVRLLFSSSQGLSCYSRRKRFMTCFLSTSKRYLSSPNRKDIFLEKITNGEQSSSSKITKDLLENAAIYADETPASPDEVWTSPYPLGSMAVKPEDKEISEENDQRNFSVVMFPGQGCQRRGMGKSLLKYRNVSEMYQTASEILNYDLLELCTLGPQEKLNETRYCQPALLVTSLAAVEKLREDDPLAVENCISTLGFSVGEFASLVFAGALSFEAAVRLVQIRGEAMQAASDLVPSGMMTVFFQPSARLELAMEAACEWAAKMEVKDPVCSIANYLYPSCKVIAGHNETLEFIELNHKAFGIKNTKRIAVSGAFHTALMKPALEVWRHALSQVTFSEPLMPVYSNVTGKPYTFDNMVKMLEKHLVSPVKWEQCLHHVYERPKDTNFPKSYECGPGQSLKAILKRVNMKSWNCTYNVDT